MFEIGGNKIEDMLELFDEVVVCHHGHDIRIERDVMKNNWVRCTLLEDQSWTYLVGPAHPGDLLILQTLDDLLSDYEKEQLHVVYFN